MTAIMNPASWKRSQTTAPSSEFAKAYCRSMHKTARPAFLHISGRTHPESLVDWNILFHRICLIQRRFWSRIQRFSGTGVGNFALFLTASGMRSFIAFLSMYLVHPFLIFWVAGSEKVNSIILWSRKGYLNSTENAEQALSLIRLKSGNIIWVTSRRRESFNETSSFATILLIFPEWCHASSFPKLRFAAKRGARNLLTLDSELGLNDSTK